MALYVCCSIQNAIMCQLAYTGTRLLSQETEYAMNIGQMFEYFSIYLARISGDDPASARRALSTISGRQFISALCMSLPLDRDFNSKNHFFKKKNDQRSKQASVMFIRPHNNPVRLATSVLRR